MKTETETSITTYDHLTFYRTGEKEKEMIAMIKERLTNCPLFHRFLLPISTCLPISSSSDRRQKWKEAFGGTKIERIIDHPQKVLKFKERGKERSHHRHHHCNDLRISSCCVPCHHQSHVQLFSSNYLLNDRHHHLHLFPNLPILADISWALQLKCRSSEERRKN